MESTVVMLAIIVCLLIDCWLIYALVVLASMESTIREAKDKKRFYKPARCSTFTLPTGVPARYIRYDMLWTCAALFYT